MNWSEIALICVSVALILVIFGWIITMRKQKIKDKDKKVDGFEVIDGVRYTKDAHVVEDNDNVRVTLRKGDVMLQCGKEYKVGKDLLAGKYTVLTADENIKEINIRIGGLVREYKHFSSIVLTEGDIISAVSANVVLR